MDVFDFIAVGGAKVDIFLGVHDANQHFRLNEETSELCIKSGDKVLIDKAHFMIGGNAANVAVGLARAGLKSSVVEEVGSDEFAQKIINTLNEEGVSERLLKQVQGASSFSVIINYKRERTIFIEHEEREHNFSFDNISTKWIYLTSLGYKWRQAYRKTLKFVKNNNIKLAFNPGTSQLDEGKEELSEIFKNTEILFLAKEEAVKILNLDSSLENSGENMKKLLALLKELGSKVVVITDGKNGSFLLDENNNYFSNGIVETEVVEKTGAGDAYASGFLSAVILGFGYKSAMKWGTENSASVIGKVGAQPGLLNREELEKRVGSASSNIGYNKYLFILPFDHRSTFEKGMFEIGNEDSLTDEQKEKIKEEKKIIYEGFKKAVSESIPKEFAAILVDEEYGDEILKNAREENFITLLTVEKSGQKEFGFEYADEFGEHIKKYNPTFAKALVRYNPEDGPELKERQLRELKRLNDFCHGNNYKFMIEVLIGVSESQLSNMGGDKNKYDRELRPRLAVEVVREFQEKGVDPDVWKMEGMGKEEDYRVFAERARIDGRDNVGIVILGRGAEQEVVEKWITAGAKIEGVIGFAVGRTVFWDPLVLFKDGKISRDEAVDQISKNFQHFYNLFMREKHNI